MTYNTYKGPDKKQTTLVLPEKLWGIINQYCIDRGLKKNHLIVEILEKYFESRKDLPF